MLKYRTVSTYHIEGKSLKLERLIARMTQNDLAVRLFDLTGLKIDAMWISRLERKGEFPADEAMLKALLEIFK